MAPRDPSRSPPRPRPRGTPCARAASSPRRRRPRRCAETFVRRWSSVPIPLRSNVTPAASSPSPRRAARGRPRRASGRTSTALPVAEVHAQAARRARRRAVHCFSRCSAMPRFLNAFAAPWRRRRPPAGSGSAASRRSSPRCRSAVKIEANSQPMIPPPSTTSRRGTSVWASSPVESTHRGESMPRDRRTRSGTSPWRRSRSRR